MLRLAAQHARRPASDGALTFRLWHDCAQIRVEINRGKRKRLIVFQPAQDRAFGNSSKPSQKQVLIYNHKERAATNGGIDGQVSFSVVHFTDQFRPYHWTFSLLLNPAKPSNRQTSDMGGAGKTTREPLQISGRSGGQHHIELHPTFAAGLRSSARRQCLVRSSR
jgi:hypothetical protein